jgi:hypothetical protein
LLAVSIPLAAALAPAPALAAPTPKERALAKADWVHGKQLMAVKNFADAADAFKKADERDPKAQYKLDLARAIAELGQLVEADELCATIQALDERNADKEKAAAKDLDEKLSARIPTIKITVSGPPADAVHATIDDEPLKVGELVKENPGEYTVRATADSYEPVERHVSVAEGEKFEVTLAMKALASGSGPVESSSSGGNMWPAGIAFGVGGAAIVAGTVMGILAFQLTSDIEDACHGTVCPPSAVDDIAVDQDYGNASTGLFVVGGVGVATGIVLALTVGRGSKHADKEPEKALVVPYVTPFGAGITGRF